MSFLLNLLRIYRLRKLIGSGKTLVLMYRYITGRHEAWISVPGIKNPVFCRLADSDIRVLKHVFLDGEYDIDMDIEPAFIIDGGSNAGYTAVYFANRFPAARIIAIEPDSVNFMVMEKNCAAYTNIKCIKAALWSHSGLLQIIDPGAQSWAFRVTESSTDEPAGKNAIEATTIPDILQQEGVHTIDLLKLDIEGSEKEVFTSNYESWLGNVQNIILELHDEFVEGCTEAVKNATGKYDFSSRQCGIQTWVFSRREIRVRGNQA